MLDIQDERARGLDCVRINGVDYVVAPRIQWYVWSIAPNTKVRAKKSDTWKPRPCWQKYCAFKDACAHAGTGDGVRMTFEPGDHVVFRVPMPETWPAKKKAKMVNTVHEQTPDVDNLLGGLFDAVCKSKGRGGKGDQHIHTVGSMKKIWAWNGAIEIGRPM